MIILGIETSCDETGGAVLKHDKDGIHILSNVVASSASIQAKYGGVIPEQAAREQIKSIIPVIEDSLRQAQCKSDDLDAIAVTFGPGLIGSLLVGVETAKTLALVWDKPLIPVNHLIGHFYANWINQNQELRIKNYGEDKKPLILNTYPSFPCIGLLVSGGHTDLVLFTNHGKYQYLGGTRDDAAGECFDKCARLLGLPYPGGPAIAQSAMKFKVQNSKFKIELPRPLITEKSFDFSFSGLKTATLREVERLKEIKQLNSLTIQQLSYEIQAAIVDVLVAKTIKAAQVYKVKQIMIAGGVAANQKLVSKLKQTMNDQRSTINLYVPPPELCTDNAAMIASAAFFSPRFAPAPTRRRRGEGEAGQKPIKNPLNLQADPNLSL